MALTPSWAPRLFLPDFMRALAIGLMIIFHTCFDLKSFGIWDLQAAAPLVWHYLPNLIVSLFFMAVGFSLALAHPQHVRWKKFLFRAARIALAAGAISGVTYWYLPHHWIYFGTLHCIVVVSFLALPLRHYPKISLMLAVIILSADLVFKVDWPWWEMSHAAVDYIPPLPWISAVLLGIWFSHQAWHTWRPAPLNQHLAKLIKWLGRHALLIYLIHQPIIYALCAGVAYLRQA